MALCYKCGTELPEKVYRNTTCERCGQDAKVCLNCAFYSPGSHWECRESISEAVREKDRANFCDFFQQARTGGPSPGGAGGSSGAGGSGGGGSSGGPAEEARRALGKLFGDE